MSGTLLFALGAGGVLLLASLVRRIIACNIMSKGAFLVLIGLAQRDGAADPVPQAMVLTGIVVSVAATALAPLLTSPQPPLVTLAAGMDWAIVVLWISSLLNAAYFLPILWRAWRYAAPRAWPEEHIPAAGARPRCCCCCRRWSPPPRRCCSACLPRPASARCNGRS